MKTHGNKLCVFWLFRLFSLRDFKNMASSTCCLLHTYVKKKFQKRIFFIFWIFHLLPCKKSPKPVEVKLRVKSIHVEKSFPIFDIVTEATLLRDFWFCRNNLLPKMLLLYMRITTWGVFMNHLFMWGNHMLRLLKDKRFQYNDWRFIYNWRHDWTFVL